MLFFCTKIKELPKYTNKSTHRKIVAKVGHKADLFANIYNMFVLQIFVLQNVLQKYLFWKFELLLFKDKNNEFIIGNHNVAKSKYIYLSFYFQYNIKLCKYLLKKSTKEFLKVFQIKIHKSFWKISHQIMGKISLETGRSKIVQVQ